MPRREPAVDAAASQIRVLELNSLALGVQPGGRANLVQWLLLRDFSGQLSRSGVEASFLLFFG